MFGNLKIKDIARLRKILSVLIKYGFGHVVDALKLKHIMPLNERLQIKAKKESMNPIALRKILDELGGTFSKLGQLLSLRPDLIPQEYCDELAKLQEHARPFPTEDAKEIVEKELKKPIHHVFERFDDKPIASASVSQIYRAVLKGNAVAVKVQRPGIRETFEEDIHLIRYFAELFKKHIDGRIIDIDEIISEFERYTYNELDFIREGKNINNFHRNFENNEHIHIPKVFWNCTTGKVLTIEYLHGKNISDKRWKNDMERRHAASRIANMIFKQIFIDGFFHADPHPGNVFISDSNRIILLDFGITGHLDDSLREKLTWMFIAIVKGDLDGIAHSLVSLNMVDEEINIEQLKEDIYDNLSEFYGVSLDKINLGMLFRKMINIAKKDRIKLPSNFILLGKSLVTTESLCYRIYPGFNIIKEAKPFVEKLVKKRTGIGKMVGDMTKTAHTLKDFILSAPEQTTKLLTRFKEADQSIKEIDKDMKSLTYEMDKSTKMLSLAMLTTALLIAASLALKIGAPVFWGISMPSLACLIAAFFLLMMLVVVMAENSSSERFNNR